MEGFARNLLAGSDDGGLVAVEIWFLMFDGYPIRLNYDGSPIDEKMAIDSLSKLQGKSKKMGAIGTVGLNGLWCTFKELCK